MRKVVSFVISILTLSGLSLFASGATNLGGSSVAAAATTGTYALFTWTEGANFTVAEWWNNPAQAACDYANNPWPQAELAAQRAYVLGARSVMRDEWDINSWIARNRASTSQARIHGTETGCYNGHTDYPPHVHILYLSVDSAGVWHTINSHHYPNALGKIYDNFVIPSMCGQSASYHPAVNTWLDILDETCTAAWQQSYTTTGDLELRRSPTDPVYALRIAGINGDLATLDVLLSGSVIYTIDIVQYDPVAMTMVAHITDYRKNLLTVETWQGDPANGITLASHTVQTTSLGAGSTPTPEATSTPTPPPEATSTPTPAPSPTATPNRNRDFLPFAGD